MAFQDGRPGTAEWREPTSSDRLPIHRSESPTGYSSAGCSPAEPASASPVSDIVAQSRSGEAIKCAAQPHFAVQALAPRLVMAPEPGRVRRRQECHLYFARRVSFLSCADSIIQIPGIVEPAEIPGHEPALRIERDLGRGLVVEIAEHQAGAAAAALAAFAGRWLDVGGV